MPNFLEETLQAIAESGHTEDDIVFVGRWDGTVKISWEDFKRIASFCYDNDYGISYIPLSLVIVFSDGSWIERMEYDGSEWWRYCETPKLAAIYTIVRPAPSQEPSWEYLRSIMQEGY